MRVPLSSLLLGTAGWLLAWALMHPAAVADSLPPLPPRPDALSGQASLPPLPPRPETLPPPEAAGTLQHPARVHIDVLIRHPEASPSSAATTASDGWSATDSASRVDPPAQPGNHDVAAAASSGEFLPRRPFPETATASDPGTGWIEEQSPLRSNLRGSQPAKIRVAIQPPEYAPGIAGHDGLAEIPPTKQPITDTRREQLTRNLAILDKPIAAIEMSRGLDGVKPPDLASEVMPPLSFEPTLIWGAPWPKRLINRYPVPFCHRPLYFEEPNLERCGHHWGFFQTASSATHFLGNAFLLPYRMIVRPPCELQPTLGDCPTCHFYCLDAYELFPVGMTPDYAREICGDWLP